MRLKGRFGELLNVSVETAPDLTRSMTAIRVTQNLGERTLVAYVPVTDELLNDAALIATALDAIFDKTFRPWRYPDPNPMPEFALFPRVAAAQRALRRLRRKRK